MITYQDLLKKSTSEEKKMDFVRSCIADHMRSDIYKTAKDAYEYNCHRNVTITEYQKILYKVTGEAIPDNWSANFKMACRHFHRFITQETQYLLGNGITWGKEDTEARLGTRKYPIDGQLKKGAKKALWGGVAFGFYNLDHVDIFSILEFMPLYDEEDGAMKAGIRFWQIDEAKPLRATLYEMDGYTEYMWRNERGEVTTDKRAYKVKVRTSEADGDEIYDGENYEGFPIVPLWGNDEHQSLLVGLREQIDCYDLIKSGFANTVDEASYVYWTLNNAGGMEDIDLAKFVERMKTVHAAVVDDYGARAESHTQEAPYASRVALLDRLDRDLYKDAMALDTERIAGGAVTATQIEASYEDLNSKVDDFEYCILEFLEGIMRIAGVDDEPTFTRSKIVNQTEMVQIVLQAAPYLDDTYVTKKILDILGDGDQAEDILKQMDADDLGRINLQEEEEEPITEQPIEE